MTFLLIGISIGMAIEGILNNATTGDGGPVAKLVKWIFKRIKNSV